MKYFIVFIFVILQILNVSLAQTNETTTESRTMNETLTTENLEVFNPNDVFSYAKIFLVIEMNVTASQTNELGGPPEGDHVLGIQELKSVNSFIGTSPPVAQETLTLVLGATYLFICNTTCNNPVYISTSELGGGIGRIDLGMQYYSCENKNFTFTPTPDLPSTLYYQSEFNVRTGGMIELIQNDSNSIYSRTFVTFQLLILLLSLFF